jgi:hypothetical protein
MAARLVTAIRPQSNPIPMSDTPNEYARVIRLVTMLNAAAIASMANCPAELMVARSAGLASLIIAMSMMGLWSALTKKIPRMAARPATDTQAPATTMLTTATRVSANSDLRLYRSKCLRNQARQ